MIQSIQISTPSQNRTKIANKSNVAFKGNIAKEGLELISESRRLGYLSKKSEAVIEQLEKNGMDQMTLSIKAIPGSIDEGNPAYVASFNCIPGCDCILEDSSRKFNEYPNGKKVTTKAKNFLNLNSIFDEIDRLGINKLTK